jgi:hypothetical protein
MRVGIEGCCGLAGCGYLTKGETSPICGLGA